jgi:hypothetical protein
MRALSETFLEINDLHMAILNFQELDRHLEWTPPLQQSAKIMKINDLHKAGPGNQRLASAN